MITTTSEKILARLKEIVGPKTIEDWGGEIDDLIKQAARLPGIFLVYTAGQFGPNKVMGSKSADREMVWTVVVVDKSLRGLDAAAQGCYQLIEQVHSKLIGFALGNNAWLWPVSEGLIHSENGKLAYGLNYTATGLFTP
jgi:phage gp37-like protein